MGSLRLVRYSLSSLVIAALVFGAAGGAVAAKKTGTELEITPGSVVPATLRAPFEYRGP